MVRRRSTGGHPAIGWKVSFSNPSFASGATAFVSRIGTSRRHLFHPGDRRRFNCEGEVPQIRHDHRAHDGRTGARCGGLDEESGVSVSGGAEHTVGNVGRESAHGVLGAGLRNGAAVRGGTVVKKWSHPLWLSPLTRGGNARAGDDTAIGAAGVATAIAAAAVGASAAAMAAATVVAIEDRDSDGKKASRGFGDGERSPKADVREIDTAGVIHDAGEPREELSRFIKHPERLLQPPSSLQSVLSAGHGPGATEGRKSCVGQEEANQATRDAAAPSTKQNIQEYQHVTPRWNAVVDDLSVGYKWADNESSEVSFATVSSDGNQDPLNHERQPRNSGRFNSLRSDQDLPFTLEAQDAGGEILRTLPSALETKHSRKGGAGLNARHSIRGVEFDTRACALSLSTDANADADTTATATATVAVAVAAAGGRDAAADVPQRATTDRCTVLVGELADVCAICLGQYGDGEKVHVLPCLHIFHAQVF